MTNQRRRAIFVFIAAVLPFFAALQYFVLFSGSPLARHIYTATKIFTLIWPLVVYRLLLGVKFPEFPLFRNVKSSVLGGVVTGLVVVLLLLGTMETPLGDVVRGSLPKIRNKAESLGVLEYYIPFALFLSLIHSLIEEYYWRWFVFGELRTLLGERVLVHTLAALAFASHHIVIATQFFPFGYGVLFGLGVGVGGALWSMMYSRQGALLGAWISHMIVDLGILGVGYRLLFYS